MTVDFKIFLCGYIFCMVTDVVMSICMHFLEKARYYCSLRKKLKKGEIVDANNS